MAIPRWKGNNAHLVTHFFQDKTATIICGKHLYTEHIWQCLLVCYLLNYLNNSPLYCIQLVILLSATKAELMGLKSSAMVLWTMCHEHIHDFKLCPDMLKHLVELGPIRKMKKPSCIAMKKTDQPSILEVTCPTVHLFSIRWVSDTAISQRPGVILWSPSTSSLRWSGVFPHQSCMIISLIMNFYGFFRTGLGLISVWGKSYRQRNVFGIWSWCRCRGNSLL